MAIPLQSGGDPGKAPPPAPRPPATNLGTGNNPRGVAVTPLPKPVANVNTGNNPRGVSITAHPGGQGIHQAVQHVFAAQNPQGQAAIVKGVLSGRADPVTAKAVRDAVASMGNRATQMDQYLPAKYSGVNLGSFLNTAADKLGRLAQSFREPIAPGGVVTLNQPNQIANAAVKAANQGLEQLAKHGRGDTQTGGYAAITNHILNGKSGVTGAEMGLNALKDAISTPAETLATAGTVGGDLINKGPGKALSDFTQPYKQLVSNPLDFIPKHPLDAYWMAVAPIHGVTRAAAAGARTFARDSAVGRVVSTNREGVGLTGNMTRERPRYSPYPLIKAGQVAVEKATYRRGPTGQLEYRSPSARAHQIADATSQIVGVNERIRSANRDATASLRARSVTPGESTVAKLGAKAAHGAKTTFQYNPDQAAIKGADVLSLIADTTIRRPDTFKADLEKYIRFISAHRPNLLDNPKLLAEHDATVKALTEAANRKYTPAQIDRLFKAAEAYRRDYAPVEQQAQKLDHFAGRSPDALLKRTLYHYASLHMGARVDPELGLVRDQRAPGRSAVAHQLTTEEILNHMKGPEGTGGRMPAFTSDAPKRGSAFYISNERRPQVANAQNTLFAYTHGLTDPSHNALLEQHVRMQGIVDAHKGQNRLVDQLVVMRPDRTAWKSYADAKADAPAGYQPIALSQPFHPQGSLDKALEGTNPATIDEEVAARGLDLSARLHDQGQGRWGLIDRAAIKRIEEHKAQIQSHPGMRAIKAFNNQARSVALGTSAKHVPGVIQESLIRDVANGNGLMSWIAGRRVMGRAKGLNPELGREARINLTGGTVAGSAKAMMTKQTSDHFWGTKMYRPLKAYEDFMKAPGPRQARTLWHAWSKLMINGMKHFVEEQHQTAGVGKVALRDFAAEHGPVMKIWRLQGQALDDAARGLFDPKKIRQIRAEAERMNGKWNDLPPTVQHAMMYTPFGLWYVNSLKWLLRAPIDRPLQTGALAAATVGTQKERQAYGLDMFGPGAIPLYMQGGIPFGGKIYGQNYYSPMGALNNPVETAGTMLVPWLTPIVNGAQGNNIFGKPLTSPGNPKGYHTSTPLQRAAYIGNSLLDLVVPGYLKAQQVSEGGASAYDSSTLVNPQTKTPGKGPLAGLTKALTPYRAYSRKPTTGAGRVAAPSWITGSSTPSWVTGSSKPSWAP